MSSTRSKIHLQDEAVELVTRRLRARGHHVSRPSAVPAQAHGALLVDGQYIEVRAARQHRRTHNVRCGGRRYSYSYKCAFYNRQVHGYRHHADLWVLVDLTTKQIALVPDDVGSLTISHHVGKGNSADAFSRYLNRWDLVAYAERRRAAA
jgi:hypothetical protein